MSATGRPVRPRLRPYLRSLVLGPEKMMVKGGTTTVVLRGAAVEDLAAALLPALDGTRTAEEVAAAHGGADPELVLEAIDLFHENGLLEDAAADPPPAWRGLADRYRHQTTFWLSVDGDRYRAQDKLAAASVAVLGLGGVGRVVATSLAQAGVGRLLLLDARPVEPADTGYGYPAEDTGKARNTVLSAQIAVLNDAVVTDSPDLTGAPYAEVAAFLRGCAAGIFCSDTGSAGAADAGDAGLCAALNESSLELGVPWTRAVVDHQRGVVGPTVLPGETACLTCFQLRLRGNLAYSADALAYEEHLADPSSAVAPAVLVPFAALVGQVAAVEAVKLITGYARPATAGAFVSLNSITGELSRHDVLRLPRCPACGPGRHRPQMKIWDLPDGA